MPTTPSWDAPKNGFPGDLDAVNAATDINQDLGTHNVSYVYNGTRIVRPNTATDEGYFFTWFHYGNTYDVDQPFTMPATFTAIGRVDIPIQNNGEGADLLVNLCTDDGSGNPNTHNVLASTFVPASWLMNLATTDGLNDANQLVNASQYTYSNAGVAQVVSWVSPAVSGNGAGDFAAPVTSGDYVVYIGGLDTTSGSTVSSVVSIQYLGGGDIAAPVPQPALPMATESGAAAATSDAIIYIGGTTTTFVGATTTNVWVAGWDSNTGTISSWTAQASYPKQTALLACASNGNMVYGIGGTLADGTSALSDVYYGTITNGQLNGWTTGTSLPIGLTGPIVAVINGWLIVTGGRDSTGTTRSETYYTKLNTDGSIGTWLRGPDLFIAVSALRPGWSTAITDSALIIVEGFTNGGGQTNAVQVLTVSSESISVKWEEWWWGLAGTQIVSAFDNGDGTWEIYSFGLSDYRYSPVLPTPLISVPLHATGLTPGNTYHVVLRQRQLQNTSNYLGFSVSHAALPLSTLKSLRFQNTWVPITSGYAMPISIYDDSAVGALLHTYEDPGNGVGSPAAMVTALTYGNDGRLFGALSSTTQPNSALNTNPTFTSGTSPWTAVGGTLTQSSAQTHGGFPFSGLITPSGAASQSYVFSNSVVVNHSQFYLATGWVYSPNGYADFSLSINWFDSSNTYISTSSTSQVLTSATWTQIINNFGAPSGATYATIVPTLSGSPAVTDLLYLSDIELLRSYENTDALSSVAEIVYDQTVGTPSEITLL